MRKDLPFKILQVVIILISCALLGTTLPILIKFLVSENPDIHFSTETLQMHLTNLYFGLGIGIILSILSLLRFDSDVQIKLARFLLILSTLLSAITYVLIKSSS